MRSKKFFVFLLLLNEFVQQVYASCSGDARNFLQPIILTEQAKSEIESELAEIDQELKKEVLTLEERGVLQRHHDLNTRALSQTTLATTAGTNNIEFAKGIYDGSTNKLWVFAAQNGGNQGAIGNFFAKRVIGDDTVIFNSAAPLTTTLNTVSNFPNPLYDKDIVQATLSGIGNLPVVLYGAGTHVAALGNAAGTSVFNNGTVIYDANIAELRAELETAGVALASDRSTNPLIIVAIPQGGSVDSVWGTGPADGMGSADGQGRGFAILQNNGNELVQKDPTDVTAALSQSFQLNLAARSDADPENITVAFYQNGAGSVVNTAAMASDQGGDKTTMCRDEILNRYFVGLQNVSRGEKIGDNIAVTTNLDGGVISLLVAGIDAQNAFFVNPVLANPVATAFATTDDQAIIGFYRESGEAEDYRANIYRACVMHTSTGRDYMIINGGVVVYDPDANPTLAEVYALPIMPASSPNAGQLATTHGADAFTLLNAATENLITVDRSHTSPDFGTINPFTADERRAVVGADPRFLDKNQKGVVIQDMYIAGDSVIVAVGGNRGLCLEEAGIFQSTALFDNNGLIVGFTPWQRVGQPYPDAAYAVGFDVKTGNYMYLTTNRLNV